MTHVNTALARGVGQGWTKGLVAAALALTLAACGGDGDSGAAAGGDGASARADAQAAPARGGSRADRVAQTYIGELETIASALEGVTDEATAQQAAVAIAAASERLNALGEQVDGEMSETEAAAMFMTRSSEFVAVQQRLGSEMMRIGMQNPALMQSLSEAMEDLPDAPNR